MTDLSKISLDKLSVKVFYDAKTRCSFCWKYFGHLIVHEGYKKKIVNNDQVFCLACLIAVKKECEDITFGSVKIKSYNKTVSTGNLTRHLRDDHQIREAATKFEDNKPGILDNVNVSRLAQQGSANVETPRRSSRNKKNINLLGRDLALWFCQSLIPFDSVSDEGMLEFFKKYKVITNDEDIPSCQTVSGSALSSIYNSMLSKVKDSISADAAMYFAMTFDLWTNQYLGLSYITYTLHYLDLDFDLKTFTLSTEIITGEKAGEKINATIKDLRKKFALDDKNIIGVTNGGKDVKQALSLANITHHLCLAHALHNLVTVDGLKSVPEIATLVHKCQGILKVIRNCALEMQQTNDEKVQQQLELLGSLDKIVELIECDERDPIPDVDVTSFENISVSESASGDYTHIPASKTSASTRWHIVLESLESMTQACNRDPINNILKNIGEDELRITSNEWVILEELLKFLNRFHEVVQIISSQKTCTLNVALVFRSEIIDILNSFQDDESIIMLRLKRNMLANINNRFPVTKMVIAAALLDNRFISLKEIDVFLEKHNMTKISFLSSFIKEVISINDVPEINVQTSTCTAGTSNDLDASLLHKLSKKHSSLIHGIQDDPIEQECWRYIAVVDPMEPNDGNLLSYWNNRKKTFPFLSTLAKAILCVPATNTPSEMVFSEAGLTISAKKSRLSPSRVDKVIFIHNNYATFGDMDLYE